MYPAEVEAALEAHPAVRSSAVIGLPDDDLGQRLHAILETAQPVSDDENGAPLYLEAFDLYPDVGEDHPLRTVARAGFSDLSLEEKTQIREALEGCHELFAKLEEARSKPKCQFDRDYSHSAQFGMSDVPKTGLLSHLLVTRAQSKVSEGDLSAARDSIDHVLALSEAYREEPMLFFHFLRLGRLVEVLEGVNACVAKDTTLDELRAWHRLMPPPTLLDGAAERALRGELASITQVFAESPYSDNPAEAKLQQLDGPAASRILPVFSSTFMNSSMVIWLSLLSSFGAASSARIFSACLSSILGNNCLAFCV